MDYQLHYNNLISKAKNRILFESGDIHHIIPRSMGGNNSNENLVKLSNKEHYVAHHLLWKIYGNQSMTCAFWMMCNARNNSNVRITARAYESIRLAVSLNTKKRMTDPEVRKHLSDINMGHPVSLETRKKTSDANTGRKQSQETIDKRSVTIRSLPRRTLEEIHGEERAAELKEIYRQNSTGRKQSKETIAKRVEKLKGKECTEETRSKISKANSGKIRTDEMKENISKGHIGLKQTEESNAKRSISLTGKPKSEEHRKKMRKPKTEEHKRKISETKQKRKLEKLQELENNKIL